MFVLVSTSTTCNATVERLVLWQYMYAYKPRVRNDDDERSVMKSCVARRIESNESVDSLTCLLTKDVETNPSLLLCRQVTVIHAPVHSPDAFECFGMESKEQSFWGEPRRGHALSWPATAAKPSSHCGRWLFLSCSDLSAQQGSNTTHILH